MDIILCMYQRRRYKEALSKVEEELKSNIENYFLWEIKLMILVKLRRPEEILKCANEALIYCPDEMKIEQMKVKGLKLTGRFHEALEYVNKLLVNNHSCEELIVEKASILESMGKYEEVITYFNEVLEISDNSDFKRDLYYIQACSFFELCRYEEAIESLKRYVEHGGTGKLKEIKIVECLIALYRYEEAVEIMDRLFEDGSKSYHFWEDLRDLYSSLGEYEKMNMCDEKIVKLIEEQNDIDI